MIKKFTKKILKSEFLQLFFAKILNYYLLIVYITSKVETNIDSNHLSSLKKSKSTVFATWHNQIAFAIIFFKQFRKIYPLASMHSDGKFLSEILKLNGYEVIQGSTSKGAISAIKHIIENLKKSNNIFITPDGPRGPIYSINSTIIEIVKKYGRKIIPVNIEYSKKITLNSWDKFQLPLPFCKIFITLHNPIIPSNNLENDKDLLKQKLSEGRKL